MIFNGKREKKELGKRWIQTHSVTLKDNTTCLTLHSTDPVTGSCLILCLLIIFNFYLILFAFYTDLRHEKVIL